MGLHNKFGVFLIGVNLLIPSLTQALVIQPVKIDSSQGEPLYAEIPFYNAESKSPIQVSMAQPSEMEHLSAANSNQLSHLNFYVRQNAQGNGVIVITSSRPVQEENLNLVLKISDGNQTRLQQLRTKLPNRIQRLQASLNKIQLQPKYINNEKDIQLNLPETAPMPVQAANQPLLVKNTPPPLLNNNQQTSVIRPTITTVEQTQLQKTIPVTTAMPPSNQVSSPNNNNIQTSTTKTTNIPTQNKSDTPNLTISITQRQTLIESTKPITAVSTIATETPSQTNREISQNLSTQSDTSTNQQKSQHVVKANESLWGIASGVAQQQKISVQQAMQQIKMQNQHAFINGNVNRLRQGAILNLPNTYTPNSAHQPKAQTAKTESPPKQTVVTPQKQTDAHMSIVANQHGTLQGSTNTNNVSKAHNELTIQVKQQRHTTLNLQNNVKQLDQQLKSKEQRIALLNARLAELEQQLKSKKTTSTDSKTSQTTSKSQGVVPALIAGTLIAFSGLNSNFAITTLLQELV